MAMYADLYADQGSYFSALIKVGSDAINTNLTGYTSRGKIRKSYSSSTYYDFITTIPLPTSGQINIQLLSTVTATIKAGRYLYDIEIIHTATGKVTRVAEGQIEFSPSVTSAIITA